MTIAYSELNLTLLNVARAISPAAELLEVREDGHGFGIVLWSRGPGDFVVHRWATVDTAGASIKPMFYSGGYYTDETEARADFNERPASRTY